MKSLQALAICFLSAGLPSQAALILHYDFNQAPSNTVSSQVGSNRFLAASNTPGAWASTTGPNGFGSAFTTTNGTVLARAGSFATTSATLPTVNALTTNQFTVALWTRNNAQASSPFYLSNGGTRIIQAHIPWSDNNVYFDVDNDISTPATFNRLSVASGGVSNSTWAHWAFVFDGTLGSNQMKVYRNGNLLGQGNASVSLASPDWDQINNLELGAASFSAGWVGSIDDFRLYDNALTQLNIIGLTPEPTRLFLMLAGLPLFLVRRRSFRA